MMFTLVFPNEFQTCQSEDTRKDQKSPPISRFLFIPLLWFGERVCVIDRDGFYSV